MLYETSWDGCADLSSRTFEAGRYIRANSFPIMMALELLYVSVDDKTAQLKRKTCCFKVAVSPRKFLRSFSHDN